MHGLGSFTLAVETVGTSTLLLESVDVFSDVLFSIILSSKR